MTELSDGLDVWVRRRQERTFLRPTPRFLAWAQLSGLRLHSMVSRFLYAEFEMLVKQLVRDAAKEIVCESGHGNIYPVNKLTLL